MTIKIFLIVIEPILSADALDFLQALKRLQVIMLSVVSESQRFFARKIFTISATIHSVLNGANPDIAVNAKAVLGLAPRASKFR